MALNDNFRGRMPTHAEQIEFLRFVEGLYDQKKTRHEAHMAAMESYGYPHCISYFPASTIEYVVNSVFNSREAAAKSQAEKDRKEHKAVLLYDMLVDAGWTPPS